MSPLPQEAEKLLAVEPNQFVAERDRIVRALRSEDRRDEADVVASLRKPSVVVFAVNRAARDRPKAAAGAAEAARKVRKTQVSGDSASFRKATAELETALELLAEVAVAHVAPRGKGSSDAMRRRVRDLLRTAVADDDAREALVRGALTEELETVGFSSYAGMAPAPKQRKEPSGPSHADAQKAKLLERKRMLREELAQAEERLENAERAARDAARELKAAERATATVRAKLERAD